MTTPDHVRSTRAAYDVAAPHYADRVGTELSDATEGPLDRSVLAAFAGRVSAGPTGRVADVGCGPGRVAAWLAAQGFDVVGFDVAPGMVAVARRAHPDIEFDEGLLDALPVDDATLAGVVCWYSIIHTPPDELDRVAVELCRVLTPGGQLLMAFQAGAGESVHRNDVYGRTASLTSYRHDATSIEASLAGAGLDVTSCVARGPELAHETTAQAFLLAQRPASHQPSHDYRPRTGSAARSTPPQNAST